MTVKTIAKVKPAFPFEAYSHVVSPIDAAEGGGFMFTMPDIPGVVADGATELEAIADGREAFIATVSAMMDMGQEVPAPAFNVDDFTPASASGKVLARLPRSMHMQLTARAKPKAYRSIRWCWHLLPKDWGDAARLFENLPGYRVARPMWGCCSGSLNRSSAAGSDFDPNLLFQLTSAKKAEVAANCDHLQKLVIRAYLVYLSNLLPEYLINSRSIAATNGLSKPETIATLAPRVSQHKLDVWFC